MPERKDAETLWKRLIEAGEERLGQIAEEVLASPQVADALGAALNRAARTKGTLDRNMQLVLGALNVPTRQDYNKILGKIEALQGSLVNLNIKLDRLLAASGDARKRPAPRARGGRGRGGSAED